MIERGYNENRKWEEDARKEAKALIAILSELLSCQSTGKIRNSRQRSSAERKKEYLLRRIGVSQRVFLPF